MAALGASGRTATEFFTSAPAEVIRLIPESTRLDMVDYFNYGSTRASDNYFGGPARVKAISDATVTFEVDENVEMQIAVIPQKNDTVIAVITTVFVPTADSSVKFYDKNWDPLKKPPYKMPEYGDWLTREGKENEAEITLQLPFIPVYARVSDDGLSLTLTNGAKDYLSKATLKELAPQLIPQKTIPLK